MRVDISVPAVGPLGFKEGSRSRTVAGTVGGQWAGARSAARGRAWEAADASGSSPTAESRGESRPGAGQSGSAFLIIILLLL